MIDAPLWTPEPAAAAASSMAEFAHQATQRAGRELENYAELHAWSVDSNEEFWRLVWDACGVIGERGERVLVTGERMQDARWFPDARLNFAENLLRDSGNPLAIVSLSLIHI